MNHSEFEVGDVVLAQTGNPEYDGEWVVVGQSSSDPMLIALARMRAWKTERDAVDQIEQAFVEDHWLTAKVRLLGRG